MRVRGSAYLCSRHACAATTLTRQALVLQRGAPIPTASRPSRRWLHPENLPREPPVPHDVPPETEIVAYDHGDAPGLTVRGEIDIATSPQLKLALDKAIRESVGAFVLDLCEVEFLDSSGLNLVLRARAALAREARPLAIVCPPGPVRRVMEIAGVDDLLFLYDTHADVSAALIPPH